MRGRAGNHLRLTENSANIFNRTMNSPPLDEYTGKEMATFRKYCENNVSKNSVL